MYRDLPIKYFWDQNTIRATDSGFFKIGLSFHFTGKLFRAKQFEFIILREVSLVRVLVCGILDVVVGMLRLSTATPVATGAVVLCFDEMIPSSVWLDAPWTPARIEETLDSYVSGAVMIAPIISRKYI